jgi:hypothetical protein
MLEITSSGSSEISPMVIAGPRQDSSASVGTGVSARGRLHPNRLTTTMLSVRIAKNLFISPPFPQDAHK